MLTATWVALRHLSPSQRARTRWPLLHDDFLLFSSPMRFYRFECPAFHDWARNERCLIMSNKFYDVLLGLARGLFWECHCSGIVAHSTLAFCTIRAGRVVHGFSGRSVGHFWFSYTHFRWLRFALQIRAWILFFLIGYHTFRLPVWIALLEVSPHPSCRLSYSSFRQS